LLNPYRTSTIRNTSLDGIYSYFGTDGYVLADGCFLYRPIKDGFPNLSQILSDKGRNFKMLHIQIRNFKNWLRGVHSYCGRKNLHKYILMNTFTGSIEGITGHQSWINS